MIDLKKIQDVKSRYRELTRLVSPEINKKYTLSNIIIWTKRLAITMRFVQMWIHIKHDVPVRSSNAVSFVNTITTVC